MVWSLIAGLASTPLVAEKRSCIYGRGEKKKKVMNSSRGKVPARERSTLVMRVAFRRRLRIVVTWLILPVVICLSQRLSHACLSINNFVL